MAGLNTKVRINNPSLYLFDPYPPVLSPLCSLTLSCGERKPFLSPLSTRELASAEGRGYLGRGLDQIYAPVYFDAV